MMARKRKLPSSESQEAADGHPKAIDERYMTTGELMDFLGVSRTKVWQLVNEEGLPGFKMGGEYRFLRSEVMKWMEKYRIRPEE